MRVLVHNLALSFFYLQLLWLDASKYLIWHWNICVLPWFLLLTWLLWQLVWLVETVVKLSGCLSSCHTLLVLKYKEIILFHVLTYTFWQPLWSVVLVITCYSWIAFCFLWTFLMFDFAVGRWVCVNFYLVSSFLPYRELVWLVSVVVPQLNAFVCTFGS